MLGNIVPTSFATGARPLATERTLLDLFAPTRRVERSGHRSPRSESLALWRADAIHRARNLAQLTQSLARIVEGRGEDGMAGAAVVDARALARAYDELGHDDGTTTVPCAALLDEIASRLVRLFGRSRGLATLTDAQPLSLEPDRRRALVLICSELVINALKYGSWDAGGGTIAVMLACSARTCQLMVEDDGTGDVTAYAPGHGSGLLTALADVLGATIVRAPCSGRGGYRVSVTFAEADPRA